MTKELHISEVRAQFPALSRANSRGIVPAYFDGPGGTQVPRRVLEAMTDYLVGMNSNIEGEYEASVRTDELIARARAAGGVLVNGDPKGIAFGQNATTLNFLLTRAFGRLLEPGDEILTSTLDHDANVAPWLLLAQDRGLVVRQIDATGDLELDLDDLAAKLTSRTKAVAYTLASNAVGTLTPAARIAELAHRAGALAWVDAVHYAPHRRIDVQAIGCDVLLCSPYKFFGPHMGMAWLRPDLAAAWPAERVRPAGDRPPGHRFETGTLSHEALAGFVAAVAYLRSLGDAALGNESLNSAYAAIGAHEQELTAFFMGGLRELPGWRLLGVPDPDPCRRVATFGLLSERASPQELAKRLGDSGYYTWNGNFYALNLVRALGLDENEGMLRIGFAHYNTTGEVARLLDIMGGL
ncbi:MAG TPA: cysteine desulfurase-like protein [Streptosporangiaceae bacterium]|jgi:cysteine desulfurase family protein (TIGR01976 family)